MIYHGGEDSFFDFKPFREGFLLDFVDLVEVEPETTSWEE